MKQIGYWILYWMLRALLSLRYRIRIEGMDLVLSGPQKGILVLPNHPAEIDPLILTAVLWPKFKPRPLAVEHFYYQKGMRFFMDLVGTLPLPSLDIANPWKIRQIEKLKTRVLEGLEEGENFLIYPSGKLKTTPEEQLGGTSMVHDLLQQAPSTPLLLVRTEGLWGSRFSRALQGSTPDFGKVLLQGLLMVLQNGLFFTPRREVVVTVAWADSSFPRKGSRLEVNRALEAWYNQKGAEPIKLVSSLFWKEKLPSVEQIKTAPISIRPVPQEIRLEILSHLAKVSRHPQETIREEWSLSNDLGLDSLDVANLYLFIEERYGKNGFQPGQLQTVAQLLQAAVTPASLSSAPSSTKKRSKWPMEKIRPPVGIPEGETIQEVFLNSCMRMGSATACVDPMTAPRSYATLRRAALVLALKIEEMEGEKIGILLPSSVAASVVVLAVLLAGKVPVMLNWTAGEKSLEYAAEICHLKTVLSSYKFLSRLDAVTLGKVDDQLLLLEEIRRSLSLKHKLHGALRALLPTKNLLKRHLCKADDEAVIIFTSGTETLPKGVPLTHFNLLSNQRSALSCVQLKPTDILYGVLPPFHSFGFSVTGILPLLAGLKVCYSPDPTDSRALARDIEHWKATIFCCAPSFIQSLLRVASGEQLKSLRLVVSGAEKAPQELFESFERLGIQVLEGYGISECSPIVTLDRPGEAHKGVGKPIPGVELSLHDDEIWITGPNVFNGYLGNAPSPFENREGKRWYRSGDRGYLDPDGTLILTGRLKRFIKIGGEMVSLGGIEEELLKLAPVSDKPALAVTAIGRESEKPEIIVFATFDLTREQASQFLKERGHSRLVKIAEVRRITEIPLTGTGKTHYRRLDELAQS